MAGEFLETLDGDLSIAFNRDVDVVAAFGLTQERDSYAIGVLVDMKAKLWDRYGALSDRQLAFAQKLLDEAVERRAKAEAIAAERATENRVMAPEGRQIVEGVIVARKFYEGDFSNYHKIGVKVEQGDGVWVLWVTEPNSVGETQRGDIIRMNVTVKRSAKDESFAWGSRPAKAEVIGNVGDECGGMDSLADPDEV